MDSSLASPYPSASQAARAVTEAWVSENLYCPSCPSESLESTRPGTKVVDFRCPECSEPFQLKSKAQPFHDRVIDSAYDPMIQSILTSTVPNFVFLRYQSEQWIVRDLFLVPRHFLSASFVEKRHPLKPTARRSGWVGCNLLLSALPQDARIHAVRNGIELPSEAVRAWWRAFSFLKERHPQSRGWMADVLACVREIRKSEFSLTDIYAFEERLRALHIDNRNVRPKIRQQLQVLRDRGVLEFLGRGEYRILLLPQLSGP
jgi:type II restriction enzyme